MAETELEFLLRRAAEELARADALSDPVAAEVHRRMAGLYASKIAELRDPRSLQDDPPVSSAT